MKKTLMTLEKGITSLMIIPHDIENMFEIIYKGKVPDQWLKSNIKTLINITFMYLYYIQYTYITYVHIFKYLILTQMK